MSIFLDMLFPRQCFGCGDIGQYLCPKCRQKLVYKSVKKGDRLSLFRYHGAIKNLITSLKFNFVSDIVPEITDYLTEILKTKYPNLLDYWQQSGYALIPVPLHPHRLNWRGFNQSELICRGLSQKLKLHYNPNILIRIKNTSPQTSIKDKLLRHSNITNSFEYRPPFQERIKEDLKIILFDDVYTTGSTINSAASAFPKNTNIWKFTIAG